MAVNDPGIVVHPYGYNIANGYTWSGNTTYGYVVPTTTYPQNPAVAPSPEVATPEPDEGPLAWLDRRVGELCEIGAL